LFPPVSHRKAGIQQQWVCTSKSAALERPISAIGGYNLIPDLIPWLRRCVVYFSQQSGREYPRSNRLERRIPRRTQQRYRTPRHAAPSFFVQCNMKSETYHSLMQKGIAEKVSLLKTGLHMGRSVSAGHAEVLMSLDGPDMAYFLCQSSWCRAIVCWDLMVSRAPIDLCVEITKLGCVPLFSTSWHAPSA
jgi:hypothetical protein